MPERNDPPVDPALRSPENRAAASRPERGARRTATWLAVATVLALLATSCATGSTDSSPSSRSGSTRTTSPTASSPTPMPHSSSQGTASAASVLATPCGWRTAPPATYASVVWVWMENRSDRQVLESSTMPHLEALARRCGVATNSHAVTHPSLPNYLAAVSGSTGGVVSDCGPLECPQGRTTLFDQLTAAHESWATYAQGMPAPCSTTPAYPYAPKHNPAVYFPALRTSCWLDDVPLGTPEAGPLRSALTAGRMPSFALVVPGLCDDGHDCPDADPDRWIAAWLPLMLTSPQYRTGGMVIVITYDEGTGGYAGQSCVTSSAAGCRIATVVLSPTTYPGTRDATSVSHYSLLRTTEDFLGLRTHLGAAADAASMRAAFHV